MKVYETEAIGNELALNMCVHGAGGAECCNLFYRILLVVEQYLI